MNFLKVDEYLSKLVYYKHFMCLATTLLKGEERAREDNAVSPALLRQTRQMSYHFCSWYGTQGVLPYHILALVIAVFVLCCLVIRLQWQQNVINNIKDRVLLYKM